MRNTVIAYRTKKERVKVFVKDNKVFVRPQMQEGDLEALVKPSPENIDRAISIVYTYLKALRGAKRIIHRISNDTDKT